MRLFTFILPVSHGLVVLALVLTSCTTQQNVNKQPLPTKINKLGH